MAVMEIQKVTIDELRNYDLKRLAEIEKEVRKEIASIRTSVFSNSVVNSGKKRSLKKTMARPQPLILDITSVEEK